MVTGVSELFFFSFFVRSAENLSRKIQNKIQTFINDRVQNILQIFKPNKSGNKRSKIWITKLVQHCV